MGEVIAAILFFLIVRAVSNKNKKTKKAAGNPAQRSPVQNTPAQAFAQTAKEFAQEMFEDEIETLNDFLPDPAPVQPAAPEKPVLSAPPKPKAKTSIELAMESFRQMDVPKRSNPSRLILPKGVTPPGESITDEHGCIGGSLAHASAEGETLHEHAAHEQHRQERLAAEAVQAAPASHRISAKDLRQAVVMSEILNRPKALRR